MEKITFKIVYAAQGSTPRQIELKSSDRHGNIEWLDKSGADYTAEPPLGVSPVKLNLTSTEFYTDKNGEKKKRVFGLFSYVCEKDENEIKDVSERLNNIVLRKAHMMLKTHQACIYRDKTGNDINPNRHGASVMFELIEESQNIQNAVELNNRMSEAMNKAGELLKGDATYFMDFCYAYGIVNVAKSSPEELYNDICQRIIINPEHFLTTFNNKNNQTLVLLRKGLEYLQPDNTTLVSLVNNIYYMNGEILGESEDVCVYNLNQQPKLKEWLMLNMNIAPDFKAEVVQLPPASDHPVQSDSKKLFEKGADEAAVSQAKSKINYMFTKAKTAIAKDPSRRGEILEKLEEDLQAKRSDYVTLLPYIDDHISTCKKYFDK